MDPSNEQRILDYWEAFLRRESNDADAVRSGYQAWSFGNNPDMANHLGNLVLEGVKTATASLVWSYDSGDDPLPTIGQYSIILNGQDMPLCIIQTTELDIVPFDEVDEAQAYLEGEGDRSLAYWREVHWKFFEEECRLIGRLPELKMPVLCERFTLVYPSSAVDDQ